MPTTDKNNKRMENRKRIIELLTAVRYRTNDIEKVAEEICLLFNFVQQNEQLKNAEHEGYKKGWKEGSQYGYEAAHEKR